MKKYVIDAEGVSDERSFFQLYLEITCPEGAAIFGQNRERFGMQLLVAGRVGLGIAIS